MLPCLYSVVKNMSGAERHFGFLPPHGVTLADEEELSIAGNVIDRLALDRRFGRIWPKFEALLDATDLVILKTPSILLYDATVDGVRQLAVEDHEVVSIEPCWGYYSEENESEPHAGG